MKHRPLIIDEGIISNVKKLMTYAHENPYTMEDILAVMNGKKEPAGKDPNRWMIIPFGYIVVYNIEIQEEIILKHFSVKLDDKHGVMPNPLAVEEILEIFEMDSLDSSLKVVVSEEENCVHIYQKHESA